MTNQTALAKAAATALTAITIITVAAEYFAPFKEFLANLTGHHWVTKSLFSVILFAAAWGALIPVSKAKAARPARGVRWVVLFAALNIVAMWAFFTLLYVQRH